MIKNNLKYYFIKFYPFYSLFISFLSFFFFNWLFSPSHAICEGLEVSTYSQPPLKDGSLSLFEHFKTYDNFKNYFNLKIIKNTTSMFKNWEPLSLTHLRTILYYTEHMREIIHSMDALDKQDETFFRTQVSLLLQNFYKELGKINDYGNNHDIANNVLRNMAIINMELKDPYYYIILQALLEIDDKTTYVNQMFSQYTKQIVREALNYCKNVPTIREKNYLIPQLNNWNLNWRNINDCKLDLDIYPNPFPQISIDTATYNRTIDAIATTHDVACYPHIASQLITDVVRRIKMIEYLLETESFSNKLIKQHIFDIILNHKTDFMVWNELHKLPIRDFFILNMEIISLCGKYLENPLIDVVTYNTIQTLRTIFEQFNDISLYGFTDINDNLLGPPTVNVRQLFETLSRIS